MSKQTAVNFLRDEAIKLVAQAMQGTLNEHTLEYQISEIVTKAMAMEREQIVDAHFTGSGCNLFDLPEYRINSAYKAAQQYYGEKFGGKDE